MIIAVSGGKGGVGKSTVALNLARELEAAVIDCDLATADLPRGTGPDVHDVLAGRIDPVDAVQRIGSVDILPCGRTLVGARASDLTRLPQTAERLEREYGHVILDCPAGLARDVGIQLATAHLAVLVTTPTQTALVDAFRTRQVALDLETPIAAVVLNKSRTPDHDRLGDRIEHEFGATTISLPTNGAVAASSDQWTPVRDLNPNCSAVETFATLARTVERCETRPTGALQQ